MIHTTQARPEHQDSGSKLVWLLFTVLLGVVITLVSGWATAQERQATATAERVRRVEERQTELSNRLGGIDAKLDILISRPELVVPLRKR